MGPRPSAGGNSGALGAGAAWGLLVTPTTAAAAPFLE
jgi:hypothetical protein